MPVELATPDQVAATEQGGAPNADNAAAPPDAPQSTETLPDGAYATTLHFTNTTDHRGDTTRQNAVAVGGPTVVYEWTLDSDPGWERQAQWEFGQPLGQGGQHGGPDPVAGYTGPNVFGYNLAGDYANNLPEHHLTAGPIDCSGLSGVELRFWRWLGVEQPAYDHATLAVSNDGVDYQTVWTNQAEITDDLWVEVAYDIAAVADDQPTVYLRWTMGTTDGSWQYCGWNIDDIEIWGFVAATTAAPETPAAPTVLLQNAPNPFNPLTEIRFELGRREQVRLTVYDLLGRRVRTLLAATALPVGPHSVIWDATDDSGQRVSSGTYLYRLEAGAFSAERKMTLLK